PGPSHVSAAAFLSIMPRNCSACRGAPSTTAFATDDCKRSAPSADRSGSCSSLLTAGRYSRATVTKSKTRRHLAQSLERHMVTNIPHAPARFRALVAAACVLSASVPAAAGPKARLSADLADHLASGSQTIRVIVHGSRAEVEAIAARYNLQIGRLLSSGAVLVVNAGQLSALREDDTIDHLSGDIRIKSSVDQTTAEAVGADQV